VSVFFGFAIARCGVAVGMGGRPLGRLRPTEDSGSLVDMLELTAVAVSAVAQVLEVRADACLVLLVELMFVAEFLVIVGEGTLRGD
jgi:hypothetical protein